VGNGSAGVTAADHIRRHHADCSIDKVARERYHLYNRMAITKLIYGHTGLRGLYRMPEDWYDDRNITVRLTTTVDAVDLRRQVVHVATGEQIPYDRLILTAGSSGASSRADGFDKQGVFVLRTADDAMAIREDLQAHRARSAAVLGGGLLGLEAAHALQKVGLGVTVIKRGRSFSTASSTLRRAST
jgi:nitrite reductase (NADH) large subunit